MNKLPSIILTALLLAPFVQLPAAESSGTKPTIFRAVDSVRPDEAGLLIGDWSANASVEVARINDKSTGTALSWQPLKPLQVSSQSLKFVIPPNWAMGAYAYLRTTGQVPLQSAPPPVVNNDEFPDLQGWKPRACTATAKDGIVTVKMDGNGGEPLLVYRGDTHDPATLKFRVRCTKGGEGRVAWFTSTTDQAFRQGDKNAKPESANFKLNAGDWQEISVSIPATGNFGVIRLYFPVRQQAVEIDWIESKSSSGTKRWDF